MVVDYDYTVDRYFGDKRSYLFSPPIEGKVVSMQRTCHNLEPANEGYFTFCEFEVYSKKTKQKWLTYDYQNVLSQTD